MSGEIPASDWSSALVLASDWLVTVTGECPAPLTALTVLSVQICKESFVRKDGSGGDNVARRNRISVKCPKCGGRKNK